MSAHRVTRVQLLFVMIMLLVLQFYIRPRLWNARVSPDFLLIALMLFAMRSGPGAGAVAGFLVGLIEDTLTPARFGAAALAHTLVGYFAAWGRSVFFADNMLVNAAFVAVGLWFRDLIVLTSFAVVIGTLVIQGLTLRPLIRSLNLHDDDPVGREVDAARERALEAALASFAADTSPAADAIRAEFEAHLEPAAAAPAAGDARVSAHGEIHRRALAAARRVIFDMRARDDIGDDAYHRLEEELDWVEMRDGATE